MPEPGRNPRRRTNDSCGTPRIRDFSSAGFSLIEMLITLAIILVLTITFWGFGSSSHQKQQKKLCQGNLEKIFIALQIYANDNAGKFPVAPGAKTSEEALDALVPRYTADTAIFICPGSKDSLLPAGESFRAKKISYAYYQGRLAANAADVLMSDAQVNTEARGAGDEAFSTTGKPPGNNHHKYGGNFLFCDGHVESTPAHVPFSLVLTQGVVLLNPRPK